MSFYKQTKIQERQNTKRSSAWVHLACPERGRRERSRAGFTLLEMLLYLSLLILLTTFSVQGMYTMTGSFSDLRAGRELNDSALVSLERMVREIASASDIDLLESELDSHPGRLVLGTSDGAGGTVETVFFIQNGTLRIERDGSDLGPLTSENITVSDLVFTRLTAGAAEAVKIDMELTVERGSTIKQKRYQTTRTLRGSY